MLHKVSHCAGCILANISCTGVIGRWHLVNLAQGEQRLTIFRCGYGMTEVGQGSTGEDHQTPSARVCVECGESVWECGESVCGVWVTVCVECGD